MTGLRSTGALWLDITLLGFSFLALLMLSPLVFMMHPDQALDPSFTEIVVWFTCLGAGIIAIGLCIGMRTHWRVPDPRTPRTK